MTSADHVSAGKERVVVKWHGSCGPQSGWLLRILQPRLDKSAGKNGKGVLMQRATRDSEYDLNSAVTFLLLGLGIGAALGIAFNPKQNVAPQGINGRRMFGLQPRREAEERIA